MITTVKRTALSALRTIVVASALEQDHSLLIVDNSLKDAFCKDMPELVAFTSPTMGSVLHTLKASVHQYAGAGRHHHWANHPPGLAQSPLRDWAPSVQAGEQPGPCVRYFLYPLAHQQRPGAGIVSHPMPAT